MTPIVECQSLEKNYPAGESQIHALRGISLSVEPGEFLCVTGRSGSGKTTLLNCLGLIEQAYHGEISIHGAPAGRLSAGALFRIRRQTFGFVFQQILLIPHLSALDNVALPLVYRGESWKKARMKAQELLEEMGLRERVRQEARWLSGGEAQRAAIARALIYQPEALFADEPTGELDLATSKDMAALLLSKKQAGLTIIAATHDPLLQEKADRVVQLQDGQLIEGHLQRCPFI